MPNDDTFEWLEDAVKNLDFYLVKNEKWYFSFGFNSVSYGTKGEYVSRLEGHSIYPSRYFEKTVEILKREEDVVGDHAKNIDNTWKGGATADCMMHYFGVGFSSFRSEKEEMYMDTLTFGTDWYIFGTSGIKGK